MNQTKSYRRSSAASLLLAIGLYCPLGGMGATWQWDGGAGTGDWQTANNWNPNALNPNFNGTFSDRLNINGAQELIYSSVELTTNYGGAAIRGVVIGSGTGSSGTLTITGGTFSTLNASGSNSADVIGNGSGSTAVLNINGGTFIGASTGTSLGIGGGPSSTLNMNSGSATITTLIFNNTNGTINLNGGTLTASTVTLTAGTNRINFNGGTYRLGAATAGFSTFASATVQSLGAIFDTNGFSAAIGQPLLDGGGGGGLTKNGTGTLTLSSANTYTGVTTVNAGTLTVGNGSALGTTAGGTTVSSGATLDVNGQNLGTEIVTISGTGDGGNGAIVNTGATQINALGRIVLAGPATIGGANRWDLRNSSPTLNLAGHTLTKSGASYIPLVAVAVTPGAGHIVVDQGELNLSTSTNLGGSSSNTITVNNGGTLGMYQSSSAHPWTLNLNTGSTLRGENGTTAQNKWAGVVNVAGNVSLLAESGQNLTISGDVTGSGNVSKTGAGTVILTGVKSYTGATSVGAGTLQLGDGTTDGSIASSSGITLTGTLAYNNVGSLSTSVGMSGSGALTKTGAGTLTLSSNNTFSGGTIISGGTIVAAHTGALGAAGRTFRLNSGSTLDLATNTSANAWIVDMGSSNTGTILVNRATSGPGITHVMGNSTLGNATLHVQAGALVSGGSPTLQMGAISLTAGGSGTLLLNPTTADLVVTGAVNIGLNSFAKTLGLAGTSAGNEISGIVSNNLNTLSVTKTGTSTWELSGANTYTGATTVSGGTLTLSGARTGSSGSITVSNLAATDATLNISNGTHAMGGNTISVAAAPTTVATGTVNQTGGTVTFGTSGNQLLIGNGNIANTGIYNLSGGTMTVSLSSTAARGVMLGVNTNGIGIFNLSGTGTLNMTAASGGTGDTTLLIGRYESSVNNTQATFNQTGGTANVGILSIGGNGTNGTGLLGTFTVTGGTFTANQFPRLAAGNTNTAEINIGGTADVTLPAFPTSRGTSSTATITFDGGTLRPLAASGTYMGGLTAAYVKAGGVKFDVATTKDITVSQDLLTHGVSTGGGLTKAGVGVLSLSGNNTYTGATSVTAGTLNLQHNNALGTTAGATSVTTGAKLQLQGVGLNIAENLTLGTGGAGVTVENVTGTNILSGTITRNGALYFTSLAGHLTVQSGIGNTNNSVNLGGAGDGEISGPISVAFSVNKNDGGTWTLSGNNTYTSTTTVNLGGALRITHNNALGTTAGGTSVGNLGALQMAGGITVTGESLSLNGPGVANDGALRSISGNNTWAGNIAVGAATVTRMVSDADLLTITGTVGLSAPVSNQFVLQGDGDILLSGAISGTSSLTSSITGTGVRTLGTANTYTGTTTVSGGTLRLLNNGAVSSGTLRLNGGRLTSDANPRTLANALEVPADSSLGSSTAGFQGSILLNGNMLLQGADSSRVLTVDSPVTLAGTITGSSLRGITKAGSSTLTLSGSGNWSGNTGVTAGTFLMTGSSSIPSGGNLNASGTGVFRMNTTGVVNTSSTSILDSSKIWLEAGTLRTNSIAMGGSGTFDWSGGTLTPYSNAVLGSGLNVSQPGGSEVFAGRSLVVTGDLTTGAGTNLDLGDLYLSGPTLYNQITITGSLSVGSGTTLSALETPYYLRPSTGGMSLDWGTLVLVDAAGGIVDPSNFNFVAPLPDGRAFSEFTGTWVSAGDPAQLDPDTWYLEYTANQVLFHYKVSAAIPEPASAGLLIGGGLLLRVLSRRRAGL